MQCFLSATGLFMDMKVDPSKEENYLSPPSDPAHAPPAGPSCLTVENCLNIYNFITDPLMSLDRRRALAALILNQSRSLLSGPASASSVYGRKSNILEEFSALHYLPAVEPGALSPCRHYPQTARSHEWAFVSS